MELMSEAGATRVVTNADRLETIAWYERHFGYRRVGEVPKVHEFGLPEVDSWTTLEAPLPFRGGGAADVDDPLVPLAHDLAVVREPQWRE